MMNLVSGTKVRLIQMPDGYCTRHLPLTVGNTYKVIGYDGSHIIITTDDLKITGSIWHGRIEPVKSAKN